MQGAQEVGRRLDVDLEMTFSLLKEIVNGVVETINSQEMELKRLTELALEQKIETLRLLSQIATSK